MNGARGWRLPWAELDMYGWIHCTVRRYHPSNCGRTLGVETAVFVNDKRSVLRCKMRLRPTS